MFDFQKLDSRADEIIALYEQKQAAMLPLLWLVQNHVGYIPPEGEQWVCEKLGVTVSHVREAISFYTMYRTAPIGKHHVQVCMSLPCLLKGSGGVLAQLKERLGIGVGQTTADQKVTLSTVECLCACEIAPMAQINEKYVGPLTPETLNGLFDHILHSPEAPFPTGEMPMGSDPKGSDPFYVSTDGPILSKRFKNAEGTWFDAYVADGGYQAAKKVLTSMTPAQVIEEVTKSNLRGLGGRRLSHGP